jgi:hypothetical protein
MDKKVVQSSVEGHDQRIGHVVDQSQIQRRLLLKTDAVVLPLIVLTSTLAFLDKVRTPVSIYMQSLADFA